VDDGVDSSRTVRILHATVETAAPGSGETAPRVSDIRIGEIPSCRLVESSRTLWCEDPWQPDRYELTLRRPNEDELEIWLATIRRDDTDGPPSSETPKSELKARVRVPREAVVRESLESGCVERVNLPE
jgi:hypothetical protein